MKNLLLRACVVALALLAAPAFAQVVRVPVVTNSAGSPMPAGASVLVSSNGTEKGTSGNPMVTQTTIATASATSTPCSAVVTTSAVTPTGCAASFATGTATIGGFAPQLGRNLRILITGTWTGTVTVGTSGSSTCTTFNPLTIGGASWGSFSANANEFVDTPSVSTAYYCLQVTVLSGSPTVSFLQ